MIILTFKKERLERDLLRRLEETVAILSRESGEQYALAKVFWGRYIIARVMKIVVAAAGTNARPPDQTIVAVDDERSFLPSVRDADFRELCERLGLTSEDQVQRLRELVRPTYGLRR